MSETIDWDRSHRWVLRCTRINQSRIAVAFGSHPPSVRELMALRKLVSEFADMPPAELKKLASRCESMNLGVFPEIGAQQMIGAARKLGLALVVTDASTTTCLPVDETTGSAWCISDDAKARRVYEAMRREGVPELWTEEC